MVVLKRKVNGSLNFFPKPPHSTDCQDVENVPFHLRKAVPLHLVEARQSQTIKAALSFAEW